MHVPCMLLYKIYIVFLQEAYMNVPCMLLYKSLHSFFTGSIHECSLYVAMQKFTIFVFIQTMQ